MQQRQQPESEYDRTVRVNRLKLFALFLGSFLLLGQAYNAIPFIFLDPTFQCYPDYHQCTEKQACVLLQRLKSDKLIDAEQIAFKTVNRFDTSSFVTQYGLYCEKKIKSVNTQSANFLGHFLSCLTIALLSYKMRSQNYIIYSKQVSLCIAATSFIMILGDWEVVVMGIFLWAFVLQAPNTLVTSAIPYFFPKENWGTYFSLIQMFFPLYTILNPLLFYLSGSWRLFVAIFIGIPALLLSYGYYLIEDKVKKCEQNQLYYKQMLKATSIQGRASYEALYQSETQLSLKSVYQSRMRIPFFSIVIICFYPFVNGVSVLLALSGLSGNFIVNYEVFCWLQVASALMALVSLKYFQPAIIIRACFSLTAFLYMIRMILPEMLSTPLLIVGKAVADMLWPVSSAYICQVLPNEYQVAMNSARFCFMLLMSSLLPYLNYLAWLWDMDQFFLLGLLQLTGFLFLYLSEKHRK